MTRPRQWGLRLNKASVGIVTETRLTLAKKQELIRQGCLLADRFLNDMNDYNKANYQVIMSSSKVIFRLEQLYQGTRNLIELALKHNKTVELRLDNITTIVKGEEDWKYYDRNKKEMHKHPILLLFEESFNNYKLHKEIKTRSEQIILHNTGKDIESMLDFVNKFKNLYDIDIDADDILSVSRAYESIEYYLKHDIDYSNPANSTDDSFPFELISFGDLNYMEDFIYNNR